MGAVNNAMRKMGKKSDSHKFDHDCDASDSLVCATTDSRRHILCPRELGTTRDEESNSASAGSPKTAGTRKRYSSRSVERRG